MLKYCNEVVKCLDESTVRNCTNQLNSHFAIPKPEMIAWQRFKKTINVIKTTLGSTRVGCPKHPHQKIVHATKVVRRKTVRNRRYYAHWNFCVIHG